MMENKSGAGCTKSGWCFFKLSKIVHLLVYISLISSVFLSLSFVLLIMNLISGPRHFEYIYNEPRRSQLFRSPLV